MSDALLSTKFFIPPPRHELVPRPRLIERLNAGLLKGNKLTLISAPAGFGKTTLASLWLESLKIPIAWLSLDERDKDPARFLTYLIAALQNVKPGIGLNLQAILQSPQPLQIENILTLLINEITANTDDFLVVLDDYHSLDSLQVDRAMKFLIDHQPAQMHLVISTREDPDLPLARLRAQGQCIELRAADLQFTPVEASEFLNQVMGLNLSDGDICALEIRTEGWIAGLQMAAISLQGLQDTESFIQSFTGSHRFVMDYLLEEVHRRQPKNIQTFLQKTSILDRMCGSLCDAILQDPTGSSQSILEYLERANLFITPQDNERHWYRYHHLFASLLYKRLGQNLALTEINRLNIIASEWYENNDMILEAFRHATAANDIERAMRLMASYKMPTHLRGTVNTILDWMVTLPIAVFNSHPELWCTQAEMLLLIGQTAAVEEKLVAAEAAPYELSVPESKFDDTTRDLIGKIASIRANLAQTQIQIETMYIQANRALDFLLPSSLSYRSSATCALGYAYYWQGDWDKAKEVYYEALTLARKAGDIQNSIMASIRLGQLQKDLNQLNCAVETYKNALMLLGDFSNPIAVVAYLGLAEIYYRWNYLDEAEQYAEQGLKLAQQYDQIFDRIIMSELHLAIIKMAQADLSGAAQCVSQAEQTSRQKNFSLRQPNIAFFQTWLYLHQGNLESAAQLTRQNDIPLMQARVLIRQNNPAAALEVTEMLRRNAESKGLAVRLLEVMVVHSVALYVNGEQEKALEVLNDVLGRAEPEGLIRLFLDEGAPMADLLLLTLSRGLHQDFVTRLLNAFAAEPKGKPSLKADRAPHHTLIESQLVDPLSPRELEVLRLLAKGLSNQQICERLCLALDTVKGHNRRIFDKLDVSSRSEAIARAHELNLL